MFQENQLDNLMDYKFSNFEVSSMWGSKEVENKVVGE